MAKMELELNVFFDVQPSEERNMFAMAGHTRTLCLALLMHMADKVSTDQRWGHMDLLQACMSLKSNCHILSSHEKSISPHLTSD